MKRSITLLLLLAVSMVHGQRAVEVAKGLVLDTLTTAEINALPSVVKRKGAYFHNKDTGSLVTWNGTAWVSATGTGGGLQASDIGVTVQGYNANTDIDSTDDVTLTANQDIGGVKNFTDRISQSVNGSVYLGNNVGLSRTTAINNVGIGEDALSSATSAQGNVAIGSNAMDSLTTGLFNTAIGDNALATNTTSGVNIAIGADAMEQSTGGLNLAVGNSALQYTTGQRNTAVGHTSLNSNTTGQYNTGLGYEALTDNLAGERNLGLGYGALRNNTIGSYNTALGYFSGVGDGSSLGSTNASSTYSTYIGYQSRPNSVNSTNEIVIGANAVGNGSNTATIGDGNITATYLKGAVNGNAAAMTVDASGFAGNLATTDDTLQEIADKFNSGPINASSIGDGSVSNTAYQYISNLVEDAQQQIDSKFNNTGGNISGNINFQNLYRAINLPDPVNPQDAVTLNHLNTTFGANNLKSEPTGRTNEETYSNVIGQPWSDSESDGAAPSATLIMQFDVPPAFLSTGTTLNMDDYRGYNTGISSSTSYTLDTAENGGFVYLFVNAASEPTFTGTGITVINPVGSLDFIPNDNMLGVVWMLTSTTALQWWIDIP